MRSTRTNFCKNSRSARVRTRPSRSCSRRGLHCHLCCHGRGALLPHHFTLTAHPERHAAVYFLLHFPSGHPGRTLSGAVLLWSPDFPLCISAQQPHDPLACIISINHPILKAFATRFKMSKCIYTNFIPFFMEKHPNRIIK